MATMKTLNGYGFNATELNGVAASNYLKKTDTASDSAKLGGKAPEYYLQPHNLFDNSNFVDPVMQAGFNGMHGNEQYVIDRWLHLYNLGSSEKVHGGIAMTGADFYMAQKVGEDVSGKTLTFAVCLDDGTVVCGTENVGDLSSTVVFIMHENLHLMLYNGYFSIRVSTGTYTIKWAALYEGSYTADTLPPYVPKGYAAELAECQRYYIEIGTQPVNGWCYDWGQVNVFVPTPTLMRQKNPSVILNTASSFFYIDSTSYNATLIGGESISNGMLVKYSHEATTVRGQCIIPEFSAKISADL